MPILIKIKDLLILNNHKEYSDNISIAKSLKRGYFIMHSNMVNKCNVKCSSVNVCSVKCNIYFIDVSSITQSISNCLPCYVVRIISTNTFYILYVLIWLQTGQLYVVMNRKVSHIILT